MRALSLFAAVCLLSSCQAPASPPFPDGPNLNVKSELVSIQAARLKLNRASRSRALAPLPSRLPPGRAIRHGRGRAPIGSVGWATYYRGQRGACGPLVGLYAATRNEDADRYPCGTRLRVLALDGSGRPNGRWVIVTVLDRGLRGSGRIVDLSPDAFKRLTDLSAGVCRVRVEKV